MTAGVASILSLIAVLSAPTFANADACPNAEFREGASGLLPDCRAYEQVSPTDKNGGDIRSPGESGLSVRPGGNAAHGGERVQFASPTEFAGAQHGGPVDDTGYIASRTASGWTTSPISTAVTPSASNVIMLLSTPDLAFTLVSSSGVLLSTPTTPSVEVRNFYGRHDAMSPALVEPWFGISSPNNTSFEFVGSAITPDGDRLAFGSAPALTGDPVSGDTFLKVYERTPSGQLRLVSVDEGGTPFQHAGVGSTGESGIILQRSTRGAISDDGRHIFFNATNGIPRELYRRTDGATTLHVSPSKRSGPDPEGVKTKVFRQATRDGNRVFFTSAEHLTDDANTGPTRAGADLYRYDIDSDELVDISATADGGDGARVQGILGADESGDRIYYVALGQVVAGEGSATGTEPNIYLWEDDGTPDGSTRFIATLSPDDFFNWILLDGPWRARLTGDGGHLLFQSVASIPGHDNGGVQQVYRYAAGSDSLDCVSCNPNGDAPLGPASVPIDDGDTQPWEHPRGLSDDGSHVFFNTRDALVARDSNGKLDPYMWRDGQVSLLSTGTSGRDSFFYNASGDAEDVFILTADALVPQDVDDLVDLYDVRVGGGLAAAVRSDCDGEGCQGSSSGGPAAGLAGSVDLRGRGDVESGSRLALRMARLSRAQLGRLARGGRVGVRVRVNGAARIRVVARRRSGGRLRTVARATARSRAAGVVVVGLRLDKASRRVLRRAGVLRLSLRATTPGARPQSQSLRLGRAR